MANLITAEYDDFTQQVLDKNYKFHDLVTIRRFSAFSACLLASLVVSSTASRTSGIVTVTATSHGITTGATYVGFRFFYPGSPSLQAGWYDSILTIPDANTITFSAPGTDFLSESINSGSAWTTITDIISILIVGNTVKPEDKVSISALRIGDTTAVTKTITCAFGGSAIGTAALGAVSQSEFKMGFRQVGTSKQYGLSGAVEGSTSSTALILTKDIAADNILALRGTLSAASAFIAIVGAHVEII